MSISDLIVVMKDGVIHQIGKPQDVYDDPVDLFVAKFLGTPPVNVFAAKVTGGWLYIGEQAVMPVPNIGDRDVVAAIRPEGFVLNENGKFTCKLNRVEVMGRDISVVSSHESCENADIRSIISTGNPLDTTKKTVSFDLKSAKVFLFDDKTHERLYFDIG